MMGKWQRRRQKVGGTIVMKDRDGHERKEVIRGKFMTRVPTFGFQGLNRTCSFPSQSAAAAAATAAKSTRGQQADWK